ncbi:hypothetical protein GOP47_0026123 [Adiantum capillus-veneris]|uniref:Pentatricopeptide repeat-containing protein n=1 Tax=Adiantum capillus-veneris TaxID=13818 RepID=A0A9D4U3N2_ADICA|nr:hypothetical protein GOP47_0026123 [Adiantum capillus-veneris]
MLRLVDTELFVTKGSSSITHVVIQDLALTLQRCGAEKHRTQALRLHFYLLIHGLDTHHVLGNYLVPMLVDAATLPLAHRAFLRLPHPNAFSWNSLISGYLKCDKPHHALSMFARLQSNPSVHPDDYTFISAFKACAQLKDLARACVLHAEVVRSGLLEKNLIVANALIDMYSKCGASTNAKQVFDRLPLKNVVTWTSLLGAYAECGQYQEAMACYQEMELQGVIPNPITLVCILKACTSARDIAKGQEMYAEIERRSLLDDDVFLGSAVVDMYAKHGLLSMAQQVFDRLRSRNVVSWNSLMLGYIDHENGEEAVKCFSQMQSEGLCLTDVSFLCGLKACGSIGSVEKLEDIHAEIDRTGLLQRNILVGSTLVNMYAKCGSLARAQHVFDHLPVRDVVAWTALLAGYAQAGESKSAADFFDKMVGAGVKPDPIAFVVVLNACSRRGLSNKSETYFQAMGKEHGIVPIREHHSCILDLLVRIGQLDKAVAMIRQLPCGPNLVMWRTVLGACMSLGNSKVGKQAFEQQYTL